MSDEAPDNAVEHANLVLSVIQDDIRQVQLRATAALAVAAIFVTQIDLVALRNMGSIWNWFTVLGIGLLVAAGLSYFHYSQRLNQARLGIANDLQRPESLADTVETRWGKPFMSSPASAGGPLLFYRLGQACFSGGAVLLFFVVAKLILS
jgi:hypothetical protein